MRFRVLDGWRGVCALLVALHHFHADGHFFAVPFVRNSYLFVDFFFVLSGFVIAHSVGGRMTAAAVWPFVRRRFARLWPLHVVVLGGFVVLEAMKAALMTAQGIAADNPPFSGATSLAALASNIALVHALGLHDGATWNFPSWSISTEFYAYLAFAAVAVTAPGWLVPVAVATASALVVAALSGEWLHTIADYGYFRCLYGFFTGVLVHRLHGALARMPAATWLEAPVLVLVWAFVSAADKGPLSMAAPLVFGVAVLVFAFEAGPVSRLLAARPVQHLGTWSYSIYLVHTLLLVMIGRAVNLAEAKLGLALMVPAGWNGESFHLVALGGPWLTDLAAGLYLAAVVAVASLTWRLVEKPGQRLLAGRRPVGPASSAARPVP
ncbi:MAG: acyltransferase [Pseudomonadota bacterium]